MSENVSAVSSPVRTGHLPLSERAAIVLSHVLNPLVWPPVLYALVMQHAGASASEIAQVVGVAVFFLAVVPLVHVGWLLHRGYIASIEVRDRSKRTGPFIVGLLAGLAGWAIVLNMGFVGGSLVALLIACQLVNMVVLALITLSWKISIHCSALAGFASMLLFVTYEGSTLGLPIGGVVGQGVLFGIFLLVPLVMWSRVRAQAHTSGQVFAGALFGFVAPYIELYGWLMLTA